MMSTNNNNGKSNGSNEHNDGGSSKYPSYGAIDGNSDGNTNHDDVEQASHHTPTQDSDHHHSQNDNNIQNTIEYDFVEDGEDDDDDDDDDDDEQHDEQLSYDSSEATSTISSKLTLRNLDELNRDLYSNSNSQRGIRVEVEVDDRDRHSHSGEDEEDLYEYSHLMAGRGGRGLNYNAFHYKLLRRSGPDIVGPGLGGRSNGSGGKSGNGTTGGGSAASGSGGSGGSGKQQQQRRKNSYQKQNNRTISLFLFAVVFGCTLAIAFLASPLSSTKGGSGSNGASSEDGTIGSSSTAAATASANGGQQNRINTNNNNDDDNGYNNDDDTTFVATSSSSTRQVFFNTIDKVPFTPVTRSSQSVPASSIINQSLFHPSLLYKVRHSVSNNKNSTSSSSSSPPPSPSFSMKGLQPLLKTPFPTGAFYTNFLLCETTSDESTSYPIMVYPYSYKWSPTKLILSYTYIHRLIDPISIRDIFQPDLQFGVSETMTNRFVVHYDSLSLMVRFTSLSMKEVMKEELEKEEGDDALYNVDDDHIVDGGGDSSSNSGSSGSSSSGSAGTDSGDVVQGSGFESYLVQGSPYVTIKYTDSTPTITALSIFKSFHCLVNDDNQNGGDPGINAGVLNNGDNYTSSSSEDKDTFGICSKVITYSSSSSIPPAQQNITLEGMQFILQTQENLKWMVFASEPIQLRLDGLAKRTLQSTKPYSGVLRFALIPPPTPNENSGDNSTGTTTTTVIQQPPYPSIPSLNNSTTVDNLIYHSHLYPVGGSVSWDFKSISVHRSSSTSSSSSSSSGFSFGSKQINERDESKVSDSNSGKRGLFGWIKSKNNQKDNNSKRTIGTVTFEYNVRSMLNDRKKNDFLDTTISTSNTAVTTTTSTTALNGILRRHIVKDQLLMMALPHHVQVLPANMIVKEFDTEYYCIKGLLTPVVGNSWTYDEMLTDIEFNDLNNTEKLKSMNQDVRNTILDQVDQDLDRVLPTLTENVYGFGKQIARLANLAKIVYDFQQASSNIENSDDESNKNSTAISTSVQTDETKLEQLSKKANGLLLKYLSAFLDDVNSDNLLYDANFGGIITRNGLLNRQADFGNGWYNDHHFHYGYILYASAIMAKLNSTFIQDYGLHVDSLLNDVAHGRNQDSKNDVEGSFFPFVRHKSWFDGHSFASGLFPFADGKSQESSSEAVNCYYGAYLWSLVQSENDAKSRNDVNSVNFMKLLLAMEIRSTKTYWHMVPPKDAKGMGAVHARPIYNPSFEKTLMVGNLGMMDVTIATWFGTESLYVHMINFLPVTAITKELFDADYVELEFEKVLDPIYNTTEMAWKGYVVADKAILDASSAWNDATQLRSYELDSALSQSQVYYWISTMDGFVAPSSSQVTTGEENSATSHSGSSCSSNPACANLGIAGECCPTADNIMLGCCNEHSSPQTQQETSESTCQSNQDCAAIGLLGKCCPTADGTMLGCCNI